MEEIKKDQEVVEETTNTQGVEEQTNSNEEVVENTTDKVQEETQEESKEETKVSDEQAKINSILKKEKEKFRKKLEEAKEEAKKEAQEEANKAQKELEAQIAEVNLKLQSERNEKILNEIASKVKPDAIENIKLLVDAKINDDMSIGEISTTIDEIVKGFPGIAKDSNITSASLETANVNQEAPKEEEKGEEEKPLSPWQKSGAYKA